MYILAYVKNAEPPTEGFNLSNSSFPNVNGDYHRVTVQGIDDDYESIFNYLVQQGEINTTGLELDSLEKAPYFNGNVYILYGAMGTIVMPKFGNNINCYYHVGGGAQQLQDFDEYEAEWYYNLSPGTQANPQWSNDWTQHTFPTVTSYDGNPY